MTSSDADIDFVKSYDPSLFPPNAVTADVVLLTIRSGRLAVLLVGSWWTWLSFLGLAVGWVGLLVGLLGFWWAWCFLWWAFDALGRLLVG